MTKGSIKLRGWEDLYISYEDEDWEQVDCFEFEAIPFDYQWKVFSNGVRNGKITMCTGEYAANILWAIEQLWKGGNNRCVIT